MHQALSGDDLYAAEICHAAGQGAGGAAARLACTDLMASLPDHGANG